MGFTNKPLTAITLLALILSGCASNSEQTKYTEYSNSLLSNNIYAKLEHTASGWQFTQFSTNHTSNMINLKTREPNWDTKDRQCIAGLGMASRSDYCGKIENPDLFLSSSINTGNAVLSALVVPLTFGISATTVTKTVTFDYDEYTKAVRQALDNMQDRDLLQNIDSTINDWEKERQNLLSLHKNAVNNYGQTFKKSMFDTSGLVDIHAYDVNTMVSISTHSLEPKESINAASLVELKSRLSKVKEADLAEAKEKFTTANVVCYNYSELEKKYDLKVSCSKSAKIDTINKRLDGEALFTIRGIHKNRLLPKRYSLENNDIVLTMERGSINIENRTNDFITLEQVSFYYLDDISSIKNLSIELPPQSKTKTGSELSINRDFNIDWSKLKYKSLTKNIANSKTMNFGFAVKYKRSGVSHDDRAFSTKTYKLSELM
ncbi:hypothetical protein [Vibrio misgurnus]|uniref:hypothetical protein n=1 Tax=Vibrio misgurnus TaxID=2993714 RepID=UPI0023F66555|nr:hypothetical protein [Vibrio sp. VCS]